MQVQAIHKFNFRKEIIIGKVRIINNKVFIEMENELEEINLRNYILKKIC